MTWPCKLLPVLKCNLLLQKMFPRRLWTRKERLRYRGKIFCRTQNRSNQGLLRGPKSGSWLSFTQIRLAVLRKEIRERTLLQSGPKMGSSLHGYLLSHVPPLQNSFHLISNNNFQPRFEVIFQFLVFKWFQVIKFSIIRVFRYQRPFFQ